MRVALVLALLLTPLPAAADTAKPLLHGRHWMAITGKPLAATAGAITFQKGGNAVDAACAMLAATTTMWDTLAWGGETQALVYVPRPGKVVGINGLGVAPTGATPEFFRARGMSHPPAYGPLAAVTPGTPGALFLMLAEYGRLSLAEVLAPAIEMAGGYPIEAQLVKRIAAEREQILQWPASRAVFLPRPGDQPPEPGDLFVQRDLQATLRKLVQAEAEALAAGRSRREAILAAHERFYRGDIAEELVRGTRELGGLFTREDLARWQPLVEEPVSTTYKGIEVHKLTAWTQGPVMLQALNMLEGVDLKALGRGSPRYLHTLVQAMHLAFADRDFWYGDDPRVPVRGLLSKDYARARWSAAGKERNDPDARPGDPYPFQGGVNPFPDLLREWHTAPGGGSAIPAHDRQTRSREEGFRAGTTSIVAADAEGWLVVVTPSGGWVPAVIAGRTGIGLSQRMQSFVLDAREAPFNVLAPGRRPRVTLTPTLATREGRPWLAFAVQGGDTQDQNLLQFLLDVVEFGMDVQQAAEADHVNTSQVRSSFDDHASKPGHLTLASSTPAATRGALEKMGYTLELEGKTSGPVNAILVDPRGTFQGGSSDYGEDYGIGW
jgi:gamma-glutamyltranspeptidase/glutathione hydrolase